MGNKRGNPAWVEGKSGNPEGRPRGKNGLAAFHHDPDLFSIRHLRWERFCWELPLALGNGAKAARKAGYSPKSARFIASRLLKKPIIRATLKRLNEVTSLDRRTLASLLERGDLWKWDPVTSKRKVVIIVRTDKAYSGRKSRVVSHKNINKSQHFGANKSG